MKINIYSDNVKLSKQYNNALKEYVKRCSIFTKINYYKYKDNCLKETDYIILIDNCYNSISSNDLADKIKHITTYENSTISFVLLSNNKNINKFNDSFCISKVSIKEEMLIVILTEQIYRAFTILNGKKYHK